MKIIGLPKKEVLVMSVDPAMTSEDYTFVYLREGSDMLRTFRFKCNNIGQAVREVAKLITLHIPDILFVDNAGHGKYFEDALRHTFE